MPLPYHPPMGTIVVCDYGTGFREPEMVKKRLAVIVSPDLKRRTGLVAVVPLSQTPPVPVEAWHHRIVIDVPHWGGDPRWAKCDMIAMVGFGRLNLPHGRNQHGGGRKYHEVVVPAAELEAIRQGVAAALGMVIER